MLLVMIIGFKFQSLNLNQRNENIGLLDLGRVVDLCQVHLNLLMAVVVCSYQLLPSIL
jgi:hypothetical protein